MKKHSNYLAWLFLAGLCLLCSCKRLSEAEISQDKPLPVQVQTVHARKGEITRSITLPGNILPYQQATLYAKVSGYLKQIHVDKGDAVKAGDLLAELEIPEMEADMDKLKAEAEVAHTDFQRVSKAQKKAPDLVEPITVDNAKAKYDVAVANLKRLQTLIDYAEITAPFSGVITRRWVDPGAFIPAATSGSDAGNAAIVELMDFTRVRVQVEIPEAEVPYITDGIPVTVTVKVLAAQNFDGTVTRYAHALDEVTRTMLVEIEIPNPKGELRPGMYPSIKLILERKSDALVLPIAAVHFEKTQTSVFKVAVNKARKVSVKTGFNDGSSVEILEGLKPNDTVILVGKQTLNDGQLVDVMEVQ